MNFREDDILKLNKSIADFIGVDASGLKRGGVGGGVGDGVRSSISDGARSSDAEDVRSLKFDGV